MPDTLKLYRDDADTAGLDLSSYVDVNEGGINPGDEATREPVFSQGSLGYGEQLVHVQTKARPFTVALLLSAATVDALGALQQTIEGYLGGARPMIEWARQGASSSTWFRVRYGRLIGDARYDQKRESQTRYGKRLMVLTTEPFGTGARVRSTNSGTASAPVIAAPTGPGWASGALTGGNIAGIAPSNPAIGALPSIGGDAPVRWRIGIGATGASPLGDGFSATGIFPGRAVAGITATAYSVAGWNAGSNVSPTTSRMNHFAGTLLGPTSYLTDPWAPGGGFALQFTGSRIGSGAQIPLTNAKLLGAFAPTAPPAGLYRLFGCIRVRQDTAAGSSVPARAQIQSGGIRGPIATLALRSPSQWAWYDLGDLVDPTDVSINFGFPTGFTCVASPIFNLTALAAIPKHTRYFEIDNQYGVAANESLAVSADADDGVTPVGRITNHRLSDLSRSEVLTQRAVFRGDLPVTAPLGSGASGAWYLAVLAFRDSLQPNFQATSTHHQLENVVVTIAAHDRYTFAK